MCYADMISKKYNRYFSTANCIKPSGKRFMILILSSCKTFNSIPHRQDLDKHSFLNNGASEHRSGSVSIVSKAKTQSLSVVLANGEPRFVSQKIGLCKFMWMIYSLVKEWLTQLYCIGFTRVHHQSIPIKSSSKSTQPA